MRVSSSALSTRARKLQNTCPRIVSSSLWKIGLVASRCFAVRKGLFDGPELLVTETEVEQDGRRFTLRSAPGLLFSDTVAGAKASAVIYSLVLTCRAWRRAL